MKNKRFIYPVILLSLSFFSLHAEAGPESSPPLYIIERYEYEVDGMSRPGAIDNYLQTEKKAEFPDYITMENYALELKQDLINLRIFESVDARLIQIYSDERDPADPVQSYTLKFTVKDAWTFFPLLVPTFNSNDNLTLQLKVNYANVFGTLMEFNIDGDFGIGVDPISESLAMNFWNVETSLSRIILRNMSFTFSWVQAYARNIKKDGIDLIEYYTFNKSDFYVATNFDMESNYYYEVAPTVELTYNYQDKLGLGDSYIKKEPQSYGIYQRGGRDRVNWHGNFQTGSHWEAELISRIVPKQGFKGQILLSNRWFTPLRHNISYGNRILGFTAIRDEIYELGEYLRGVPDFNLSGNYGLFINNTIPVRWFNWENVMEVQVHPFSDMGIVSPADREFQVKKDMRMTLGCDFIIFPEKITSVHLRTTIGFDLFGPGDLSERFEFLLSTSLFF